LGREENRHINQKDQKEAKKGPREGAWDNLGLRELPVRICSGAGTLFAWGDPGGEQTMVPGKRREDLWSNPRWGRVENREVKVTS